MPRHRSEADAADAAPLGAFFSECFHVPFRIDEFYFAPDKILADDGRAPCITTAASRRAHRYYDASHAILSRIHIIGMAFAYIFYGGIFLAISARLVSPAYALISSLLMT